jgi:hypothetical protein
MNLYEVYTTYGIFKVVAVAHAYDVNEKGCLILYLKYSEEGLPAENFTAAVFKEWKHFTKIENK